MQKEDEKAQERPWVKGDHLLLPTSTAQAMFAQHIELIH